MVIIARDPHQLKIASGLIGEGTIAVAADLSSPAGIKAAVTEVAAQVDHVDAAFLNAGQAGIKRLDDMVFNTDVKGSFFLMHGSRSLLAPGGAVVLCGSAAGRRASAGIAARTTGLPVRWSRGIPGASQGKHSHAQRRRTGRARRHRGDGRRRSPVAPQDPSEDNHQGVPFGQSVDAIIRTGELGVGPWFVNERIGDEGSIYRGEPGKADFALALAFSGHMMAELIQSLDDEPSNYKDARQFLVLGIDGDVQLGVLAREVPMGVLFFAVIAPVAGLVQEPVARRLVRPRATQSAGR